MKQIKVILPYHIIEDEEDLFDSIDLISDITVSKTPAKNDQIILNFNDIYDTSSRMFPVDIKFCEVHYGIDIMFDIHKNHNVSCAFYVYLLETFYIFISHFKQFDNDDEDSYNIADFYSSLYWSADRIVHIPRSSDVFVFVKPDIEISQKNKDGDIRIFEIKIKNKSGQYKYFRTSVSGTMGCINTIKPWH